MTARGTASKLIGGVFVLLGVLVCIEALLSAILLAWGMWSNGSRPSFIMIGGWTVSVTEFFVINGVALIVGLGLISVGVQFFFRTPRDE